MLLHDGGAPGAVGPELRVELRAHVPRWLVPPARPLLRLARVPVLREPVKPRECAFVFKDTVDKVTGPSVVGEGTSPNRGTGNQSKPRECAFVFKDTVDKVTGPSDMGEGTSQNRETGNQSKPHECAFVFKDTVDKVTGPCDMRGNQSKLHDLVASGGIPAQILKPIALVSVWRERGNQSKLE